jgi:NTP pyrophosphatase (non-canonical NTP hydrolase)
MITMNQYLVESERTAGDEVTLGQQSWRASSFENVELLHGAMGISTEAGEILDVLKKQIYYGKQLDKVNLAEEVGDVLWYCALILRNIGMSFEEAAQMNINKLQKRFPEKFTEENAQNRDLDTERAQLEADMKL